MGDQAVLEGRGPETATVDRMVARLPGGGSGLLITGDPGSGKTSLLDRVCAQAARAGHRVLRTVGVESEAMLPYAVLGELMLPLRPRFAGLPAPQRHALERALLLADGATPEPYAVCTAVLGVLAAPDEPLVAVVDDLHCADASSRQALQFAARRLTGARSLLVLARREDGGREEEPAADLPEIVLRGLDDDAARRVLAAHGIDPDGERGRGLVRLARGNPLVLVEYAAALRSSPADPLTGADPIGGPGRPGPLVVRAWRGPLAGLPQRSLDALVFVAAVREGELGTLEKALAIQGLGLADLAPAEQRGLLVPGPDGCLRLRHPVLRPVLLGGGSRARLLGVYRALAEHAPPETRAWYRAAATVGPDEQVAAELAAAAEDARRRGAPGTAAQAWRRAAELSPAAPDRAARLLDAALDGLHAGATSDALAWCERAQHLTQDPALLADLELARGRALAWLGRPGTAHRALVRAADAVRAVDPARASVLYGAATLPAAMDGRTALASELAERASELTDTPDPPSEQAAVRRSHARILLGAARTLHGEVAKGRDLLLGELDGLRGLGAEAGAEVQQLLVQVGDGLSWLDEDAVARAQLDQVVDRVRRTGALGLLPYALATRCAAESWSSWATARADGTEAADWARELGQPAIRAYARALLASIAARAGDLAACEAHLADYHRHGGGAATAGLDVLARGAHGTALLASGDAAEGRSILEGALDLARRSGIGNPNMLTFTADLAEARLREGDAHGARELADWLTDRAAATGLAWPEAAAARCHALLATEPAEAATWLGRAEVAHARRDMPYERARGLLAHGQVLRRLRRPSAAREPLAAAQRTFEALGAATWAAVARRELAAAGHRPVHEGLAPGLDALSPQELQVARAVAGGLSNPEVAATLYLARKTVEARLTSCYRKMGIRSRADLARLLSREGQV